MDGPLVDAEGFPRADIDVYSVRHARHSIICESIALYTISCIIVMKINNVAYVLMDDTDQSLGCALYG